MSGWWWLIFMGLSGNVSLSLELPLWLRRALVQSMYAFSAAFDSNWTCLFDNSNDYNFEHRVCRIIIPKKDFLSIQMRSPQPWSPLTKLNSHNEAWFILRVSFTKKTVFGGFFIHHQAEHFLEVLSISKKTISIFFVFHSPHSFRSFPCIHIVKPKIFLNSEAQLRIMTKAILLSQIVLLCRKKMLKNSSQKTERSHTHLGRILYTVLWRSPELLITFYLAQCFLFCSATDFSSFPLSLYSYIYICILYLISGGLMGPENFWDLFCYHRLDICHCVKKKLCITDKRLVCLYLNSWI